MHDIFGEKLEIGDVVVYPYDFKDAQQYYCHEVVKVNEASVVVKYETPKRKLKRVRNVGKNVMVVKCNEEQLERLREHEVFKKLGGK